MKEENRQTMASAATRGPDPHKDRTNLSSSRPTLDPYFAKLERFELFSTNQCYYLVGCNKQNTAYRVLKMDRTMIEFQQSTAHSSNKPTTTAASLEHPTPHHPSVSKSHSSHTTEGGGGGGSTESNSAENNHTAKPTLRPLSDFLTEDPNVYSQQEIKDMLDMIHEGNRVTRVDRKPGEGPATGGLKPIVKAYGVVGFIRFLDCYYLTLTTRRAKVGGVGDHGIYTIKNTETIPLKPAERKPGSDDYADPSSVLLSMWNRGKRSVGLGLTNREIAELRYQGLYQVVDLTKNFYFSYTYDLTRSLQENVLATSTKLFPPPPFKDMYAWNHFLTIEFKSCLTEETRFHWIMPIIHGAFVQRKVNDYGRCLNITLLARRSKHFAGTRYLKRGVSEQGKVANDVEHEQILHDESMSAPGVFSSFLQVRGSIPTFWTQESSVTMPKPPIELNRVDPTYKATQLHFADLMSRYSSPIMVLDLVKQSEKREREVRVGNEYRHAIDYINHSIDAPNKIQYCALDYSHVSKHRHLDVSHALNEVSTWSVNQTGFFCSAPKWKILKGGTIRPFTDQDSRATARLSEKLGIPLFPMEQNGVLRTNCIDCLDRTNVAQFSAGVEAMAQQLVVMGIRSSATLAPSSSIVRVLIDMYVDIGDSVALQYGGSEAHKKVGTAGVSESNNITGPIGKHKELLTSIRRYYSNAFTDRLKQDAMNLFLGYYLPYRNLVPLWDMENDYYLHNWRVKSGKGTISTMKTYQDSFGIAMHQDPHGHDGRWSPMPKSTSSRFQTLVSGPKGNSSKNFEKKVDLSMWWKVALQSNFQQRMLVGRGKGSHENTLPPRFERVHQPDKLGQFDKIFSKVWETPVRRSHAAQHSEGSGDDDVVSCRRVISDDFSHVENAADQDAAPSVCIHLNDFVKETGFRSPTESRLETFSRHFTQFPLSKADTPLNEMAGFNDTEIPQEYVRYCSPLGEVHAPHRQFDPERVNEFKDALQDISLSADDVNGIRELAKSGHLSSTLSQGEYRGLDKDDSAIDVAAAIHEQLLAALPSVGQRMAEGESELGRRGFDTRGVREKLATSWQKMTLAQKQYMEVVEARVSRCERSELTTPNSLKLYASQFDQELTLTTANLIYLNSFDGKNVKGHRNGGQAFQVNEHSSFVEKARRLGIAVTPKGSRSAETTLPSRTHGMPRVAPSGFEQINENLFCRKENKFMVFNDSGVAAWTGTNPSTKQSQAVDVLRSTLT